MRPIPPPPTPVAPRKGQTTLADIDLTEDQFQALHPESREMIRSGCLSKILWSHQGAAESALRLQRLGEECRAYRCSFASKSSPHWHVGHVPEMGVIEALARTIRDLHGVRPSTLEDK